MNLPHLKARLAESGIWNNDTELTIEDVKKLLEEKFDTIDFEQARDDVRPFIKDVASLELWSADFFRQITNRMLCVNENRPH